MSAAKPDGSAAAPATTEESKTEEAPKTETPAPVAAPAQDATYATGTASPAAKENIRRKRN